MVGGRFSVTLCAWALSAASASAAETLTVAFPSLPGEGKVVVALFSGPDGWGRRHGAAHSATVAASSGAATFKVPPGRYAIMAYHDRNGDGRLNTLPVGLPTEPYGFSNNSRGTFGPPPWGKAMFEVSGATRQEIRLR